MYLLAPQALAVFADQATNMMNSAPAARTQARNYQPAYTGQRVSYAPQQREAQPVQPQPQPYGGMQDFTQRAAEPEEALYDAAVESTSVNESAATAADNATESLKAAAKAAPAKPAETETVNNTAAAPAEAVSAAAPEASESPAGDMDANA